MSVQAMAWAIENDLVTDPTARHVLLCLANYADAQGRGAFPSAARLCRDTGLSESSVRRRLAMLVSLGVIVEEIDSLLPAAHGLPADRRPKTYHFAQLRSERGVTQTPRSGTGCPTDGNGVSAGLERGVPQTPKPSINHQGTEQQVQMRSPTGSRLPADWSLPDEWKAWAQEKRPDVNVNDEAEKFADYWHATAGAKGRKADWQATWRNWIRNAQGAKNATHQRMSAADRVRANVVAAERRDAEAAGSDHDSRVVASYG